MIRGTTAQFEFKIPCDKLDDLEWVAIKFWQDGNPGTDEAPLPIIKIKSQCSMEEGILCVSLSAHETMRFSDDNKAKVQLTARKWGGTQFASHEKSITVYSNNIITPPDIELPEETEDGWTRFDGGPIGGDY